MANSTVYVALSPCQSPFRGSCLYERICLTPMSLDSTVPSATKQAGGVDSEKIQCHGHFLEIPGLWPVTLVGWAQEGQGTERLTG